MTKKKIKKYEKISTKLWMTFFIHFKWKISFQALTKVVTRRSFFMPFVRMTDELMCVNNKLTWKFMNTRSFTRRELLKVLVTINLLFFSAIASQQCRNYNSTLLLLIIYVQTLSLLHVPFLFFSRFYLLPIC